MNYDATARAAGKKMACDATSIAKASSLMTVDQLRMRIATALCEAYMIGASHGHCEALGRPVPEVDPGNTDVQRLIQAVADQQAAQVEEGWRHTDFGMFQWHDDLSLIR